LTFRFSDFYLLPRCKTRGAAHLFKILYIDCPHAAATLRVALAPFDSGFITPQAAQELDSLPQSDHTL
jgi:hypothetical protein